LWQQEKELEKLNIKVIVITFEPLSPLAFPVVEAAVNFPYYVDEERQLYQYYDILKAGFWDLWGPRTWLIYLRLLLKGRKIIKSKSDINQRGGDVLIDPNGIVHYHHIGSGPGDRPDPAQICNQVEISS
jgi:peroxiredoxin